MSVGPCIVELYVDRKNQLDATRWFIELINRSTCFGHYYAHLQELETIMLVTARGMEHFGCRLCVRVEGCCSLSNIPPPGRIAYSPIPDHRPATNKVFHATCCNQHYSLELLKMGIIVPETCWAVYKFNKPSCSIQLVFSFHIPQFYLHSNVNY